MEEPQLGKNFFSEKYITRQNPSIGSILLTHVKRLNVRIINKQKRLEKSMNFSKGKFLQL